MRGRINIMDLFDIPMSRLRELFYYSFSIKEQREKERKEQEKKKKEEEAKKAKQEEMNKPVKANYIFEKRLSPAAQARESRHKKSQDDEKRRSEEQKLSTAAELAPPPNVDMEDLIDVLEEGG